MQTSQWRRIKETMKATDTKTTTQLHTQSQAEQQPFFQKEGAGRTSAVSEQPFFQPKLKVGKPGDKYEREADATADRVVNQLPAPAVQAKCAACEAEEEEIQRKPIFESAEEHVQQKAIAPSLQPQEAEAAPEEEMVEVPEEEEMVQAKCAACEEEETDNAVQAKAEAPPQQAGSDLESRLNSTKGKGSPLPEETQTSMGTALGADFGGVRVHTDSSAVQMSQELGAHAFTHDSDIYFNAGKYDTGSKDGQKLLAHELVHTVQQGGGIRKQEKPLEVSQDSHQRPDRSNNRNSTISEAEQEFAKKSQTQLGLDEGYLENPPPQQKGLPPIGETASRKEKAKTEIASIHNKMAEDKKKIIQQNSKRKSTLPKTPNKETQIPEEQKKGTVQAEIAAKQIDVQGIPLPLEELNAPNRSSQSLDALRSEQGIDPAIIALGETIHQTLAVQRQRAVSNAAVSSSSLKANAAARKQQIRATIGQKQVEVSQIMTDTSSNISVSHTVASETLQTNLEASHTSNEANKVAEIARLNENILLKREEADDVFSESDEHIRFSGEEEGTRGWAYRNELAYRAMEMGRRDAAYYRRTEEDKDLAEDKADAVMDVAERFARQLRQDGENLQNDVQEQADEAREQVSAEREPVISGFDNVGPEVAEGISNFMDEVGNALDQAADQGKGQLDQAMDGANREIDGLKDGVEGRGMAIKAEGEAQLDAALVGSLLATANLTAQATQLMDQAGSDTLDQLKQAAVSGSEYQNPGEPASIQLQPEEDGLTPNEVDAISSADTDLVVNQLSQSEPALVQAFQRQTSEQIQSFDQISNGAQLVGTSWADETRQNMNSYQQTVENAFMEVPTGVDSQYQEIVSTGQSQVAGQVDDVTSSLDQNVAEIRSSVDASTTEATQSIRSGVDEGNAHADEVILELPDAMLQAAEAQESWLSSLGNWFSEQLADTWEAIKGMADWGFILDLAVGVLVGIAVGLLVAALIAGTVLSGGLLGAVIIGAAAGAAGFAAAQMSANVRHGDPLWQNVGHAAILGAFVGGVGGLVGPASLGGLGLGLGGSTLAVMGGAFTGTIVANLATGQEWDKNLLANTLIIGIFHVVFKPIFDRIPVRRGGRRGNSEETPESPRGRRSGRETGRAGTQWENKVRELSGGREEIIEGRQIDSVTPRELIQAKDVNPSSPKNFLNQSTRAQIKETIRIARGMGKRPVFWFRNEPLPEIRAYIQERGGTVRVGEGSNPLIPVVPVPSRDDND